MFGFAQKQSVAAMAPPVARPRAAGAAKAPPVNALWFKLSTSQPANAEKRGWQPKLAVGERGDPLEKEADRAADVVARGGAADVAGTAGGASGALPEAPRAVEDAVSAGGGRPLDTPARNYFEPRFGRDLGGVRVHSGPTAAESASKVNALAYTVGSDIVFGPGRYAPHAADGRRLLAHELAHVVQQVGNTGAAARGGAGSHGSGVVRRAEPSLKGTDAEKLKLEEEVQEGTPYIKGKNAEGKEDEKDIDPNDVQQGQLGDCWLMAGLMAMAKANPEAIRRMIKPAGEGKWAVTFHFPDYTLWWRDGYKTETVVVDAKVPVSSKGGPPYFAKALDTDGKKKELWVLLIEKAYAKTQGKYAKITGTASPSDHQVLEMIVGKDERKFDPRKMDEDKLLATLEQAMSNHRAVTLGTIKKGEKKKLAASHKPEIITNHQYVLVGVNKEKKTVDLWNPWGREYDIYGLPVASVQKFFDETHISGDTGFKDEKKKEEKK